MAFQLTYPQSLGKDVTLDDVVYHIESKVNAALNGVTIPPAPSANGTYVLTCVKSNAGATFSWVSQAQAS